MDKDEKSLFSLFHKTTGTVYMFIDNAKQFADAATLFRVVVNFILFMIKHVEDGKDPIAMGQKVSDAITQAKEMEVGTSNYHVCETTFVSAPLPRNETSIQRTEEATGQDAAEGETTS